MVAELTPAEAWVRRTRPARERDERQRHAAELRQAANELGRELATIDAMRAWAKGG